MEITEEKLNLFIDKQLDNEEMDAIHQALLENKDLRERVCQLKAVRELVAYAYSEVPASRYQYSHKKSPYSIYARAIAATVLLIAGVLLGWSTYQFSPNAVNTVSAENTFKYVANRVAVDDVQRKIVLHIDSGDLRVMNAALNEVDYLLASYNKAKHPMKLDIVTNKAGINLLRANVSPYIDRLQKMSDDYKVSFFACQQSITKAMKKEGVEIILMPGVISNKTAKELIPKRIENGWVYIKA